MEVQKKQKMLRFILLVGGGLIGALLGGLYLYINDDKLMSLPRDSFQKDIFVLRGSLIFILVTYNIGYYGMKFFGFKEQAEEIKEAKKWRTLILNILMVVVFIMSFFFK
ncbi:MAG: hypothetical protein HY811_06970 [Planctomycetes bacterium]|nr:hypothetical protein [Planctomycetota bacterium]